MVSQAFLFVHCKKKAEGPKTFLQRKIFQSDKSLRNFPAKMVTCGLGWVLGVKTGVS